MNLTATQQLVQEGLFTRINRRLQELQKTPPEQQLNTMAALTAATAMLASEVKNSTEAINLIIEVGAYTALRESQLNELHTREAMTDIELPEVTVTPHDESNTED